MQMLQIPLLILGLAVMSFGLYLNWPEFRRSLRDGPNGRQGKESPLAALGMLIVSIGLLCGFVGTGVVGWVLIIAVIGQAFCLGYMVAAGGSWWPARAARVERTSHE